ncbi:MAG: hypothetical protein ABR567_22730 [Myxococcales bacterium]
MLAGATEFAVWVWLTNSLAAREAFVLAGLRLLRPLWAKAGTRFSRMLIASLLIAVGLVCGSLFFWPFLIVGVGLPALGDLCATTIGDRITVERRAAAWAWLDMGQGLGAALGFALGHAGWSWPLCLAALAIGIIGIPALRDGGMPRSSWPAAEYVHTLRTPLAAQLTGLAFASGLLSARANVSLATGIVVPLAAMALATRVEPRMPNGIWLPRIATALALAGQLWPPLRVFGLGMMFAAIPAAVARGAGEMERPIASSISWSALFLGAAVGAAF